MNGADIVDLLTRLVEKSLVALDPLTGRYRLLETVRQYAQERLASANDEPLARNHHLAYFVEVAEKARPALLGPEQGMWLARLDIEGENLLAAHAWCNKADNGAQLGLRLVNAVKQYWVYRGYLALGYAITVEALGRTGAQTRDALRSRAQFCAGQLCSLMGRHEEAQQRLEESLAIAQEQGDRSRIAATLQPLVWAALGRGDMATARGYSQQALALAREIGSKRDIAAAINVQGQIHRLEGRLDAAAPLYETVLSLGRELGDRNTTAVGLLNLAMVAIARGSIEQTSKMLLDVVAIADEIGSKSAGQASLRLLQVSGHYVRIGSMPHVCTAPRTRTCSTRASFATPPTRLSLRRLSRRPATRSERQASPQPNPAVARSLTNRRWTRSARGSKVRVEPVGHPSFTMTGSRLHGLSAASNTIT